MTVEENLLTILTSIFFIWYKWRRKKKSEKNRVQMLYVPIFFASDCFVFLLLELNIWEEYVLTLLLLLVVVLLVRVVRKNENKVVFIIEWMACKRWNYNNVLRKENERVLNSTHTQRRLSFFIRRPPVVSQWSLSRI